MWGSDRSHREEKSSIRPQLRTGLWTQYGSSISAGDLRHMVSHNFGAGTSALVEKQEWRFDQKYHMNSSKFANTPVGSSKLSGNQRLENQNSEHVNCMHKMAQLISLVG